MFRTNPDFEAPRLPFFTEPQGVQNWRALEIVFHDFWFIVEILIPDEDNGGEYWKMICFEFLADALNLVNADFVSEHRVNLVVPANRAPSRQMVIAPIKEIYEADEGDQRSIRIYVTGDGARYLDTALLYTEDQATNKTLLYMKKNIDVR